MIRSGLYAHDGVVCLYTVPAEKIANLNLKLYDDLPIETHNNLLYIDHITISVLTTAYICIEVYKGTNTNVVKDRQCT